MTAITAARRPRFDDRRIFRIARILFVNVAPMKYTITSGNGATRPRKRGGYTGGFPMPTPKQASYIRSLMVEAGHAHPRGFLRGSSKAIPHGPSMRERSGSVDAWIDRLTSRQASEVISALKGGA